VIITVDIHTGTDRVASLRPERTLGLCPSCEVLPATRCASMACDCAAFRVPFYRALLSRLWTSIIHIS
jgi:hypothetical protein